MDWFLKNEVTGEEVQLCVGENTVGRHISSNVRCPSIYSSRHHCVIEVEGSSVSCIKIKDLRSSNGTFLNGHPIIPNRGVDVEAGDIVGVGVNSEQDGDFFIFEVLKREKHEPWENKSFQPVAGPSGLQQQTNSSNTSNAPLESSSEEAPNRSMSSLKIIKQEAKEKDAPNRKRKESTENNDIAPKIQKISVKSEPVTSNHQSSSDADAVKEAKDMFELLKQKGFLAQVKKMIYEDPDLPNTSHQNNVRTTHASAVKPICLSADSDGRKPSLDSTKRLSGVMEIDISNDEEPQEVFPSATKQPSTNNEDTTSSIKVAKSNVISETDITPNIKMNGFKRSAEKTCNEIQSDKRSNTPKHQTKTTAHLLDPKVLPGTSNGPSSKLVDCDTVSVSSESGCELNDVRPMENHNAIADAIDHFNSVNLLERPDDDYPLEDDDFEEEEEDSKNWFHQLSQTSLSHSQSLLLDTKDNEADKANPPEPPADDIYTYTNDKDDEVVTCFNRKPNLLSMLNANIYDIDVEMENRASIILRTSRSTSSSGESDSTKNENQDKVEIKGTSKLEEPKITDSIVISSDSNDSTDLCEEIAGKELAKNKDAPKSNDIGSTDSTLRSENGVDFKEPALSLENEKKQEDKSKASKNEIKGKASKKAELIEAYPMPPRKSHQRSLSKESATRLYNEQQSRQQVSHKKSDAKKTENKVPDKSSSKSKKVESRKDGSLIDRRKEKLREISERDKLKKPLKDAPKPSASVKIKCSDRNRGSFLTEPTKTSLPSKASKPISNSKASIQSSSKSSRWSQSEPSTSKLQEKSDSTIIRSGPRSRVSRVKADSDSPFVIAAETTSVPSEKTFVNSAHNSAHLKSSHKAHEGKLKIGRIPKIRKKKVSFPRGDDLVSIRFFEVEEGSMCKKVEGKDTKLPKDAKLPVKKQIESDDIVVQEIMTWRPSWLHEQKQASPKTPPPVAPKYALRKVGLNFDSVDDYYQTMKPLLYHEVWASVTQSYDRYFSWAPVDKSVSQGHRNTFHFMIESCTVREIPETQQMKRFLQLTCNVILFEEDTRQRTDVIPRRDDLVIIQLKFLESGPPNKQSLKQTPSSYFGLVCSDKRHKLMDNQYMSLAPLLKSKIKKTRATGMLTLKILVDFGGFLRDKKICTETPLEMKKIRNLIPEMRLLNALRSLPSYPLCNAIISPVSHDFSIPDSSSEDCSKNAQFDLNSSQFKAVNHAVKMCLSSKPNICMIQGAPGTGKSLVITRIIQELVKNQQFKNDNTILLCASSNAAVDELVVKLAGIQQRMPSKDKFRLVRVGRSDGTISPKAAPYTLTELARTSPPSDSSSDFDYSDIEIRTTEAKLNSSIQRIESLKERRRALTPKNDDDRFAIKQIEDKIQKSTEEQKLVEAELQNLQYLKNNNNVSNKQRYATREDSEQRLLKNAQVVAVTLSSSVTNQMKAVFMPSSESSFKPPISVCIIDEATQCTEPEALIPLLLGVKSLVLVGDPNQLSPTILSQMALEYGFGQSMFSRMYHSFTSDSSKYPLFFLDTQYRMHSEICQWPNNFFYGGKLITARSANRLCPLVPYMVLSTCCKASDDGEKNEEEADIVVNLILEILALKECKSMSIGVITPYQKQKIHIQKRRIPKDVEVNTIDSYQGSEKDIIILSTVRTQGVGFLENQQRLNVSLTRAKSSLFICGNFVSLQDDQTWKALIEDAKKRKVFKRVYTNKEGKYLKHVLK